MSRDNPYQAPMQSESPKGKLRKRAVLWWLVYLHPVIVLALIYACWVITSLSLGRPPGFGEHPSQAAAHTAVHILGSVAALALIGGLALVPIASVWSCVQPFARACPTDLGLAARIACPVGYVLMLVLFACVWQVDPLGAIYWFVD